MYISGPAKDPPRAHREPVHSPGPILYNTVMNMPMRTLGKTGLKVSPLGFGTMRLPVLQTEEGGINEEQAIPMIRTAIDSGINYIDTAYPYHGGESERLVGRALQEGYREKVLLATKLPIWSVKEHDDFYRFLDIQQERLQTDRIDLYLFHALNTGHWEKTKRLELLKAAEKTRDEGRIAHIGFSFHDYLPVFRQILEEYEGWEFCQIQYNFMDTDYQAGRAGLKLAARKGLGVVVMEPLKGGQIAAPPPKQILPYWRELGVDPRDGRNGHVRAALQWLWDQPEVSLVLSGMSAPEQVEQNIESARTAAVEVFGEREKEFFSKIKEAYTALRKTDCTACGYCMPCPSGVNIPRILSIYNEINIYGEPTQPLRVYNDILKPSERANNCIECGECEEKCPQGVPVIRALKEAHARLLVP